MLRILSLSRKLVVLVLVLVLILRDEGESGMLCSNWVHVVDRELALHLTGKHTMTLHWSVHRLRRIDRHRHAHRLIKVLVLVLVQVGRCDRVVLGRCDLALLHRLTHLHRLWHVKTLHLTDLVDLRRR